MPNLYYVHGSYPSTGSAGSSAGLRSELDAVTAGFDKLPDPTANANKVVVVNSSATALTVAPITGTGNAVFSMSPTLTNPVINSPAGIVKADVGLGNVDNTSDATKNAAVATLTNKTLTAPAINSPTGIVKADVGLGNADNTSDVNKPVSTAQTTALDLKSNITAVQTQAATAFTTAGTATAYTLTPSPAITAYTTGLSFFVNFNAASGLNPTLQISGLATPPQLVQQQADGTYANVVGIPINHRSRVTLLSATQALIENMPPVSLSAYAPLASPALTGTPSAPTATAGTNTTQLATTAFVLANGAAQRKGFFFKTDSTSVAFTKTGAGTVSIKAGASVEVAGTMFTFASDTAVTMPALAAGTDYAIYACTDGTVRADANFSAPSGYTTATSRKIGGFHYAAGGNAAARAGGDTTPAINAFSLWDLKFKPAVTDPRGMALVAGNFWADIYLLGVDHHINGTSKYNVAIADGSSAVKIPTAFGGNGTLAYTTLTWWEANEVLAAYGKRPPSYDEFAALAFGTTEVTSSGGTDVPTTGVTGTGATSAWNIFTSKWGVIQASGCLWSWADEFGGGTGTAAWTANTGGRGSTYQLENAALLGGSWAEGANAGSRCSLWYGAPTNSSGAISARGVCDHLILE